MLFNGGKLMGIASFGGIMTHWVLFEKYLRRLLLNSLLDEMIMPSSAKYSREISTVGLPKCRLITAYYNKAIQNSLQTARIVIKTNIKVGLVFSSVISDENCVEKGEEKSSVAMLQTCISDYRNNSSTKLFNFRFFAATFQE